MPIGIFEILFHHGWVMFVAVTVVNALILSARSRSQIRARPELAAGYRRLLRWFLFWGNLPWLVLGYGIEVGGVPNIFYYFRPRDGNPFVLAWFGTIFGEWILGFWWLFLRHGAEFLVAHPGLLTERSTSPAVVKISYCLGVFGGILGFIFLWSSDIPVQESAR
jgi:hypothetical protein